MLGFWVTKDGATIAIEDLKSDHLINILKLLERKYVHELGFYINVPWPNGEMAYDAVSEEYDSFLEAGPKAVHEQYEILLEEALKRGITTKQERDDYRSMAELAMIKIELKK